MCFLQTLFSCDLMLRFLRHFLSYLCVQIPKFLIVIFQVRIVDALADCDFQDTCVMELLTDFMSELVSDGELMLARALRSKFIQKYEDRRSRLLPDLDTSGLSLSSKSALEMFLKDYDYWGLAYSSILICLHCPYYFDIMHTQHTQTHFCTEVIKICR